MNVLLKLLEFILFERQCKLSEHSVAFFSLHPCFRSLQTFTARLRDISEEKFFKHIFL
jgi:hypothetical protein